jgi:tRNA (cmo5U34)-methyltransferase
MSQSVDRHLALELEKYDLGIRRVLPGYDAMVEAALDAIATHAPSHANDATHVLDLGTGSGRMAAAMLARFPNARVTLIDVDAATLEKAKQRISRNQTELARATVREGSFADPLPSCDVAMAALSLHHVRAPDEKRAVYTNIKRALSAGGVMIVADVMIPADAPLKERAMRRWADHLVAGGDTRDEAFARFDTWLKEERYFSVEEELTFIRDAGFRGCDVVFRSGPLAVVLAVA